MCRELKKVEKHWTIVYLLLSMKLGYGKEQNIFSCSSLSVDNWKTSKSRVLVVLVVIKTINFKVNLRLKRLKTPVVDDAL